MNFVYFGFKSIGAGKIAYEMTFDFDHQSFRLNIQPSVLSNNFPKKGVSQKIRGLRDATQLALIL